MTEWWNGLSNLNRVFYGISAFFSIIFVWQFISSIIGLTGGELEADADVSGDVDVDVDLDGDMDLDGIEAHSVGEASLAAFRILSIRAILAFCTLFAWAMSLYLNLQKTTGTALLYATGWGLAGGVVVTILVRWLRGLAETGNLKLDTCVGTRGAVYMNIPADGQGQVRVPVGGVLSMVRARTVGGGALEQGVPIRVVRMLDATTVEVQSVEPAEEGKEEDQ